MPTKYSEKHDMYLKNFIETGNAKVIGSGREVIAKRKDNTYFPARLGVNVVYVGSEPIFTGVIHDLTEENAAKKKLLTSQKRLQEAERIAGIGSWEWDVKEDKIIWSEETYRIFGQDPQKHEPVFNSIIDMILPEDQLVVRRSFAKAIKDGVGSILEFRITRSDREVRHLYARAEVSIDDEGRVVKVFGIILDNTNRIESEEKLRKSEKSLADAQRIAHLGSWDWDIIHGVISWSDEMYRLWGVEKTGDEVEYKVFFEGLHKDDRDRVQSAIDKALTGEKDYAIEYRVITPNGEERTVYAEGIVSYETGKKPIRMMGTVQNITERKKVELELKKYQEGLEQIVEQRTTQLDERDALVRQLLDAAGEGIWGLDSDGNTTFVNPLAAKMLGYTQEELIGKSMYESVHRHYPDGSSYPVEKLRLHQAFSDGCVHHVHDEVFWRKDGSCFPVEYTCTPISKDDTIIGAVVTFNDISERKKSEDELIKAKYQAESASRAKSEFLASMSHEIRTPMNGVLGMLGILLNTDLNVDQRRKTKIAQESAKSLLTVINDILDYSKIEAGKLDLENVDFSLRELLENITKTIAFRGEEKGIEIIVDVQDINVPWVKGDPSRLRQIITNLVANAVKFTDSGEVVLRGKTQEKDGGLVFYCEVEDSGIGIAEEQIPNLFESFTQADASTTRKYGGTGLGLTISRKLCEIMEGSISAKSEVGKGSCFSFWVKLSVADNSPSEIPKVDLSNLSILVVDDNRINREIFRSQLESWGAVVTEAESAESALACCEKYSDNIFDIALVDMHMPNMDGVMFAQAVRSSSRYDDMKMLLMSSVADKNSAQEIKKLGFSGYFVKPVSTSDLFNSLTITIDNGEAFERSQRVLTKSYIESLSFGNELSENKELSPTKKARVLLTEDNEINQFVAQNLLDDLGIESDIASNGVEAIEALKHMSENTPYALVLMDCQMPEMDGYEATTKIRQGAAGDVCRDIPVIAMTANAMLGDKERCLQHGMSDYISKPIDPDILTSVLEKWLPLDTSSLLSSQGDEYERPD